MRIDQCGGLFFQILKMRLASSLLHGPKVQAIVSP
jgi:hypothetical protein